VKKAVRLGFALVVGGLGVRSIIAMRERDLKPWSNYFGAPVTPLLVVVLTVVILVASLLPYAPESRPKRKSGGSLFRPFKWRKRA
jgi:hypothetical protein